MIRMKNASLKIKMFETWNNVDFVFSLRQSCDTRFTSRLAPRFVNFSRTTPYFNNWRNSLLTSCENLKEYPWTSFVFLRILLASFVCTSLSCALFTIINIYREAEDSLLYPFVSLIKAFSCQLQNLKTRAQLLMSVPWCELSFCVCMQLKMFTKFFYKTCIRDIFSLRNSLSKNKFARDDLI